MANGSVFRDVSRSNLQGLGCRNECEKHGLLAGLAVLGGCGHKAEKPPTVGFRPSRVFCPSGTETLLGRGGWVFPTVLLPPFDRSARHSPGVSPHLLSRSHRSAPGRPTNQFSRTGRNGHPETLFPTDNQPTCCIPQLQRVHSGWKLKKKNGEKSPVSLTRR